MTPPPQQEYIITDDEIVWMDIHLMCKGSDAAKFCLMLETIRSRPAPAAPKKTWETCNQHFTCPNGEECWYLSEDFHNEEKATIRNQTLKKLYDQCECVPLKEYAPDYDKGFHQAMTLVRCWIEQSLRTASTQEHQR